MFLTLAISFYRLDTGSTPTAVGTSPCDFLFHSKLNTFYPLRDDVEHGSWCSWTALPLYTLSMTGHTVRTWPLGSACDKTTFRKCIVLAIQGKWTTHTSMQLSYQGFQNNPPPKFLFRSVCMRVVHLFKTVNGKRWRHRLCYRGDCVLSGKTHGWANSSELSKALKAGRAV